MKFRAFGAGMMLAVVLLGGGLMYRSAPTSHAQAAPNAMAVDADAGTAGVDTVRTVNGTASFTTAVNIVTAGSAYAGYQVELSFPASLTLSASTQLQPSGMTLCGTPITSPTYQSACARSSGTSTFTGQLETVDFACAADGVFTIHMVSLVEDANFGTTTLNSQAAAITTGTADAVITCTGTGQVAPTDTPVPPPTDTPTAGPTQPPVPTDTPGAPTDTPTALPPEFTATPTPAGTQAPGTPGAGTATSTPGGPGGVATATPTLPGGGTIGTINLPNTGGGSTPGASGYGLFAAILAVAGLAVGGGATLLRRKAR